MQKTKSTFRVEVITFTALLVALQVVLGNLVQVPLMEKQYNLGFIPIAVAGALLGPIPAAVVGALGDIIGSLLFPVGAYFPGFTFTNILVGLIHGFLLYRKKPNVFRVILSALAAGIVNLFLNTLWLSILYTSKGYAGWLAVRAPSYLVEIPLQIVVIFFTLFALSKIKLPAHMRLDNKGAVNPEPASAAEPVDEAVIPTEPYDLPEEIQNESSEKADS